MASTPRAACAKLVPWVVPARPTRRIQRVTADGRRTVQVHIDTSAGAGSATTGFVRCRRVHHLRSIESRRSDLATAGDEVGANEYHTTAGTSVELASRRQFRISRSASAAERQVVQQRI